MILKNLRLLCLVLNKHTIALSLICTTIILCSHSVARYCRAYSQRYDILWEQKWQSMECPPLLNMTNSETLTLAKYSAL